MNAQEEARDQFIDQLITEVRNHDPSAESSQTAMTRLKRRLGSALDSSPTRTEPSLGGRRLSSPARWRYLVRVGVVAAFVGLVMLWQEAPTRQTAAGVAFGQVLDAIRQAAAISYTAIEELPGGGEDVLKVDVLGTRWLRLTSAGKGTRILDFKDAKLLQFDHPQQPANHAVLIHFVGPAARTFQSVGIALTELHDLLPGDGAPLGNKTIDGRAVTGFRVKKHSLIDDLEDHSIWEIWADSETARPVRIDIHHERDPVRVTLVDFDFDVELDECTFELDPPPGYGLTFETIEELDSSEGP